MKTLIRVLFVLAFTITACKPNIKQANENFNKAKNYLKKKDYANASIEINKAIKLDSTNYDYLIFSAEAKRLLDNPDEAISILQKVLSKNHKIDTAYYNIARCYFSISVSLNNSGDNPQKQNENSEKAVFYYNKALNENTKFYNAYLDKYKVLHNLKRYKDAIIVMNQANSIFPDSLALVMYRGIVKGQLGDSKSGMKDLEKAINSNTLDSINSSIAYRFHGISHLRDGKLKLALNDFTKSIEFNKENSYTYKNRADLYRKMKLKDSACLDYRKAADLGNLQIYETIKKYCK